LYFAGTGVQQISVGWPGTVVVQGGLHFAIVEKLTLYLDPADVKSYRPISNLSLLSQLLTRFVDRQLFEYLNTVGLVPRIGQILFLLYRQIYLSFV
jgi:hypothetical protein